MGEEHEKINKILSHEQKLRCFEGFISSIETVIKDDGGLYCKFSIPLKKEKDDAPDWLNCYVYGNALVDDFTNNCKKGSRVWVQGILRQTEKEGQKYVNFFVKNFKQIDYAKPKPEGDNNG